MVRINNTFDFDIYPWDTRETVFERLAVKMDSLPKYLYITGQGDIMTAEKIDVVDFLRQIKSQEIMKFSKLLKNPLPNLNIVKDIVRPFIAYNEELEKSDQQKRGALLLLLQTTVPGLDLDMEDIWRERKNIRKNLEANIVKNKETVESSNVLLNVLTSKHTPFNQAEVSFQFEIALSDLSLLELFDKIVLTKRVPFASINDLYKIFKESDPDPNWGSIDNAIYLKITDSSLTEYVSVVMVEEDNKGIAQTTMISSEKGTPERDFFQDFYAIFPSMKLQELSREIIRQKGRMYYLLDDEPIDSYVLGELVMNDPIFSKYLSIDEHEAATKKKRSSLYIHYFGATESENVKANITIYQVRKNDLVHKKYKFEEGKYYANVLVSDVKSKRALDYFVDIFGKLLTLYYEKAPDVIKFYRSLLAPKRFPPPYKKLADVAPGKKKDIPLSSIAPEVFVSGYPTKCTHQPRIVGRDEEETKSVMEYPKTPDEGFPQRLYSCDRHPTHPYPGLRTNPLSNNDIVPFLPCCFKTPQDLGPDGKGNKIFDHYFYDAPLVDKIGTVHQQLKGRDVFIEPPNSGKLPENINEMLDIIIQRPGWEFVRTGVFDSTSSFLECILEALQTMSTRNDIERMLKYKGDAAVLANKKYMKALENKKDKNTLAIATAELWETKMKERLELLSNIRRELATDVGVALCKQEMYDYNDEDIRKNIKNTDNYFDPKLMMNLIEKYFECNVILFSRVLPKDHDAKYQGVTNASIMLPRHTQAYYKTSRKHVPTILIYERLGRGEEQKIYPRCELIGFWKKNSDDIDYVHGKDSEISRSLNIIYEKVRESYNLNRPVKESVFPVSSMEKIGIKFREQYIDSYGKCRGMVFEYGDSVGSMITTPLQPMILNQTKRITHPRLSLKDVVEIFELLGLKIEKTSVDNSAYSSTIGNVRFSIPFFPEQEVVEPPKVSIEYDLVTKISETSELKTFERDRNIAKYMVEYLRWLYSTYLHENALDMSFETMEKFVNDDILINPEFEYGDIKTSFQKTSGVSAEGKLYVKSLETKKRLVYTLQLYMKYHAEELKKYYEKTNIPNYFENVTDFTKYRSQIILQGDDAVSKWIEERGKNYILHDDISDQNIYFFRNKLVGDDKIYIAQRVPTLNQAIATCNEWKDGKGANNSDKVTDIDISDEKFTLYSFQNNRKIEAYNCERGCRKGRSDGNEVLGYKDDGDATFISLLPT